MIEPLVLEGHRCPLHDVRQDLAAARPFFAAHFEDVGEIGFEFKRKIALDSGFAIVVQGDLIVGDSFGKEFGAINVQRAAGQHFARRHHEVGIRQVYREQHIVFADGRAQQQRPLAAEVHLQARQVPRLLVEDALLAESHGLNVSAAIEHREGVAIEQHTRAIVGQGRRRADVKMLPDFDYIFAESVF